MSDEKAEPQKPSMQWAIIGVAVIAAAVPHAFFAPPLELHMTGQLQAWMGIAVWAPAILAGVAFFFGVEFRERLEPPRVSENVIAAGVVTVPILFSVYMAARFDDLFSGMAGMHPWDELSLALPMYAVMGALHALFWQGYAQKRILEGASPYLRVAVIVALNVAVFVPFLLEGGERVATGLLPTIALEALLVAGLFELGATARACMVSRALCGLAFIWFQQAMFL